MNVVTNGRARSVRDGATLADLLDDLDLSRRLVVVERNGVALERGTYEEVVLEEGDRLEIVRPLGGGAAIGGARLYFVCGASMRGRPTADFIGDLAAAGMDVFQLREKEMEAGPLVEAGRALRAACRAAGVVFVVNDRPDIAVALDADGVHLGTHDLSTRVARRIFQGTVGRSTHSVGDIEDALEAGPDYVAVGPVFETPTKPGRRATGIDLVRHAARSVRIPWFAIGGIDLATIDEVLDAGARRVVVVRAIAEADDPPAAAAELRAKLDARPL